MIDATRCFVVPAFLDAGFFQRAMDRLIELDKSHRQNLESLEQLEAGRDSLSVEVEALVRQARETSGLTLSGYGADIGRFVTLLNSVPRSEERSHLRVELARVSKLIEGARECQREIGDATARDETAEKLEHLCGLLESLHTAIEGTLELTSALGRELTASLRELEQHKPDLRRALERTLAEVEHLASKDEGDQGIIQQAKAVLERGGAAGGNSYD